MGIMIGERPAGGKRRFRLGVKQHVIADPYRFEAELLNHLLWPLADNREGANGRALPYRGAARN